MNKFSYIYVAVTILFFLVQSFAAHSADGEEHRICDKMFLAKLFASAKDKNETKPTWKIVRDSLTNKLKKCLLEKYKEINFVKTTDKEKILFKGKEYELISNGIIDAPASNIGYAAIYSTFMIPDAPTKTVPKFRSVIKFSFSIPSSGEVNFHDIFETERIGKMVNFFKHKNGVRLETNNECLKCHKFATNIDKIFINAKGEIEIPEQVDK